jgi:hypothetical protein
VKTEILQTRDIHFLDSGKGESETYYGKSRAYVKSITEHGEGLSHRVGVQYNLVMKLLLRQQKNYPLSLTKQNY